MVYLEAIIGGVAAFLLGFVWYTALFGNAWKAETGMTDEDAKSGMALTHGLSFVMMCIIAFGINYVINFHKPEEQTFVHGAFHGFQIMGLYAVPAIAINYLYQKKSIKLFLIDAGYVLAFSALAGGLMAMLNLG